MKLIMIVPVRTAIVVPVFTLFMSLSWLQVLQGETPATVQEQAIEKEFQQLVDELGDDSYKVREAAQQKLSKLNSKQLPELQAALKKTSIEEVAARLKQIIKQIKNPRWRNTLNEALAEAKESNKIVMVFSTIGEVNGFS